MSINSLVDLAKTEFNNYVSFPQHAYYQHHPSILDLEKSSDNGCDLCQLIIECLKITPEDDRSTGWTPGVNRPVCELENSLYAAALLHPTSDVKVCITLDGVYGGSTMEDVSVLDALLVQVGPTEYDHDDEHYYGLSPLTLTISTAREDAVYIDDYRIGRFKVKPDLGSHGNFTIAREWLGSCCMSHSTCLVDANHALPTRVIDVGKIGSSQAPRLLQSRGLRAKYVALSHCWGGRISTLLTTETVQAFQNEVPYAALPANFQDAITITRQLGIQYLWIDSLCIVQDSKEDWERESKTMCLVYRNSTVTISAMASPGSAHGILRSASSTPHHPKPRPMRVVHGSGEVGEVTIQWRDYHEESLNLLHLRGPLNCRGWTLQEQFLSPRQLYYGGFQLYWRCPKGFASADGVLPNPATKTPDPFYDALSTVLYSDILCQTRSKPVDKAAILHDYYQVVHDYSSRKLTYDSDKLPAFSGLIQCLHPVFGGDYLAGLWSSDIRCGLLWHHEMGACRHVRPYRAPSWSWAVTNDSVVTTDNLPEPGPLDLKLIEYNIIPRNENNPYGEIVSGHLFVQGYTMPLFRSKQVVEGFVLAGNAGVLDLDETWDDVGPGLRTDWLCLIKETSGFYLVSILTASQKPSSQWEIDFDAILPDSYTALVVCISGSDVRGLVLQQASGRSDGAYERVGVFRLDIPDEVCIHMSEQLLQQTIMLV